MTPREFLAVAVLLSTNFDERMAFDAWREMEKSMRSGKSGEFWREHYEQDLQRIGAKRALWLDVHG